MRKGLLRVLQDWDEDAEYRALVEVLLPTLVMQVDSTLRDADAVDAKIGGSLILAFTAVGVLVSTHSSLNPLWWVPLADILLASTLLLNGLRPRDFSLGPQGDAFYEEGRAARRSSLMAAREMKNDLIEAGRTNIENQARKIKCFRWGFRVLLLGLVGFLVVAMVRG